MTKIESAMEWLKAHWKAALAVLVSIIAIACIAGIVAHRSQQIDIVDTQDTGSTVSTDAVDKALPQNSKGENADTVKRIERAKTQYAPQYHYYTYDQSTADQTAKQYAQTEKADVIIKDTSPAKEITTGSEQKNDDRPKVIENNYYAIHNDKKHGISIGTSYVDNDAYITAGYRNRRTTLTTYISPDEHKAGAGISYEIAAW